MGTWGQGYHAIDRLEERGVERGSVRRSSLKGRERAIVNQINIGTVSKATLATLLRERVELIIIYIYAQPLSSTTHPCLSVCLSVCSCLCLSLSMSLSFSVSVCFSVCLSVCLSVSQLRSCVRVQVDVLGSFSLIILVVSVDVKQH